MEVTVELARALLEAGQAGDRPRHEELVNSGAANIREYLRRLLLKQQASLLASVRGLEVDDAVGEVFRRLMTNQPTGDLGRPRPVVLSWLKTMCRNALLDLLRKQRDVPGIPDGPEVVAQAASPSDVATAKSRLSASHRMLKECYPLGADIFNAKRANPDADDGTIAAELGITTPTVHTRVRRLRIFHACFELLDAEPYLSSFEVADRLGRPASDVAGTHKKVIHYLAQRKARTS